MDLGDLHWTVLQKRLFGRQAEHESSTAVDPRGWSRRPGCDRRDEGFPLPQV